MSITKEGWEQMQREQAEALTVAIEALYAVARMHDSAGRDDAATRSRRAAQTIEFMQQCERGEIHL